MLLCWTDDAWADYLYWQAQDRKTLKRVNALIRDMQRAPVRGHRQARTPQMGPVRRMVAAYRFGQPYHLYRRRRQALHPLREGPLLNCVGRSCLRRFVSVFGRLGFFHQDSLGSS